MSARPADPYSPLVRSAIDAAVARLTDLLQRSMPLSGADVLAWMRNLAGGGDPAAYYHHMRGSPMFLFPWFLEKSIHPEPDPALQSDLVYSTVNGYYWVRLIDNLTDGQATNELDLLPALGFFQAEFQRPYRGHFPASHPFWDFFSSTWFQSADVTMRDLHPGVLDREQFIQVAARKICAIKIPLAAICYEYSRPDLIPSWASFVDTFGCWHQMSNDLFHWYEDLSASTPTYFLAEAERRKDKRESIPDWVMREGFAWGMEALDEWMKDLKLRARDLRSRDLARYLKFRDGVLYRESLEALESLRLASTVKGFFF